MIVKSVRVFLLLKKHLEKRLGSDCRNGNPRAVGDGDISEIEIGRLRFLMNKKHRQTLKALFENPVRSNILWQDIEKLLEALGAELSEGHGSRIRIALNDVRAVFHRPHPRKETNKGAIVSMRKFLTEAEIEENEV